MLTSKTSHRPASNLNNTLAIGSLCVALFTSACEKKTAEPQKADPAPQPLPGLINQTSRGLPSLYELPPLPTGAQSWPIRGLDQFDPASAETLRYAFSFIGALWSRDSDPRAQLLTNLTVKAGIPTEAGNPIGGTTAAVWDYRQANTISIDLPALKYLAKLPFALYSLLGHECEHGVQKQGGLKFREFCESEIGAYDREVKDAARIQAYLDSTPTKDHLLKEIWHTANNDNAIEAKKYYVSWSILSELAKIKDGFAHLGQNPQLLSTLSAQQNRDLDSIFAQLKSYSRPQVVTPEAVIRIQAICSQLAVWEKDERIKMYIQGSERIKALLAEFDALTQQFMESDFKMQDLLDQYQAQQRSKRLR